MNCVYIFTSADHGPCKVGFSTNPEKRLKSFRENGHFQLKEVARWEHAEARLLERLAHRRMAAHKIAGEWFDIGASEATLAVAAALETDLPAVLDARANRRKLSPNEVAAIGSEASIGKRSKRIRERLATIREDWAAGKIRTVDLLERVSVNYATARKVLGPRKRYRKRIDQPSLLPAPLTTLHRSSSEKERSQQACAKIAGRWVAAGYRTKDLLMEVGVSRNTALLYLGKRPKGIQRVRKSTWIGPAYPEERSVV